MSALIYYAYLNRLVVFENQLEDRLEANARSGINILLSKNGIESDSVTLDLFDQQTDSVQIVKRVWGIFDVAIIKAFSGVHQNQKVFQYGQSYDPAKRFALYLTDQDRPISIAGSTLIKGDVFLPQAGIRSTYINGKPYERDQLVFGKQKYSEKQITALNEETKSSVLDFLKSDSLLLTQFLNKTKRIATNNVYQPFDRPTLLIMLDNKDFTITNSIKGNVIIVAKQPIVIDRSAQISDALIFAPAVEIHDGFSGNLQVFVTDSLKVGDDCRFTYPSVLGLIKKENTDTQPFIHIGENTSVKGIVFTEMQTQDLKQTMIELKKNASVEGILYSNGFLHLLGNVFGTVYCNRFVLKTPVTYYENHMLDVQIDQSRLSPYFVSSSLFGEKNQKKVIKWLR
ncbi:hypothetical protein Solca_1598 [Solitalea canadensis DSM 3403]|uniref:Uncharacterized protein n=2 Tax=Solitalea canadensis TaxID=995 RepID=H8KVP2_SOLCM|nr:hypothetical protein Solca_1598 [Solitalea canadensis DSM 3403]